MEILLLHNSAWYLRMLGWTALYFYYISRLKKRFRNPFLVFVIFLAMYGIEVRIYFSFLRYTIQIFSGLAIHILLTLLLKKSDWKNICFGAVIYEVIHDLGSLVYDIEDGFLPGSALFSNIPLSIRSHLFSLFSLLLGLLLIALVMKLDIFRDKKRLPLYHMGILLIPSFLYFMVRDFQLKYINSSIASPNMEFVTNFYIILLLLAVCVLTMSVMINKILTEQLQQEELREMKQLFEQQRQDYLVKVSSANALNQKYHDLKNCLLSLQADTMSSSGAKDQVIQELEQILKPMEVEIDSGNAFLNVVLKEKLLQCQEKNIRLTPYVDARSLEFMDGLDICVLTGNLLDNAIAAVETLPQPQREIHIKICSTHGMASLHFQNPYSGTLRFNDAGLPETTKAEADEHGYGLKSAAQIAEKYHGTLTVRTEQQDFMVDILLPLPS